MKRINFIFPISVMMLIGSITSCSKPSLKQRLEKIDGIKNIKEIENKPIEGRDIETCKESYTFTITQPIDWNNKELGSFDQKVNVYYNSDNAITEYKLSGYAIFNDEPIYAYYNNELQERYKGNVISIEYRFFAKSKPEGFSHEGTKYMSYLNSYQASNDFHNVISKMKTIFNGKTIFAGASKGGYTTEMMCYFYPDDIDSYVSYVAPLCNSDKDERLHKFVSTEIGDGTYGKEKAQEYRDIIKEFQKRALEDDFREVIMNKLEIIDTSTLKKDEIYETSVSEFATGMWQYNGVTEFEKIREINNMKEDTTKEKEAKIDAIAKMIKGNESSTSDPSYISPYYSQAKMEMGNYYLGFDNLRAAGLNIKTDENRDLYVHEHSTLTDEQIEVLKYTPIYRNALIDFYNTTKKDLVKIVGYSDPWYSVKAPVTDNSHIHLFEAKSNHTSGIKTLEESKKNEAFGIIDKLVGYKN